jgi:SAM-dependent methyltransferase
VVNDYYANPEIAEAYDPSLPDLGAIAVDDIPFYVGLAGDAAKAGREVLELGCGTGRVTIPIAQAGVPVTGLDSSAEMLSIARAKAQRLGATGVTWWQADMAAFTVEKRFGLIIIPLRSFLMLLTLEEQRACLTRVHDHLIEGGRLALNIFNPSPLGMAVWIADRQDMWRRRRPAAGIEDWFKRDFDIARQLMSERQTRLHLSPEGVVTKRTENSLRLRWIHRYEMQYLLELTGFEIESLSGWFDGREFNRDSEEMVWLARKAG